MMRYLVVSLIAFAILPLSDSLKCFTGTHVENMTDTIHSEKNETDCSGDYCFWESGNYDDPQSGKMHYLERSCGNATMCPMGPICSNDTASGVEPLQYFFHYTSCCCQEDLCNGPDTKPLIGELPQNLTNSDTKKNIATASFSSFIGYSFLAIFAIAVFTVAIVVAMIIGVYVFILFLVANFRR